MRSLINSGYRYALSLCSNKADAEDLLQEAWTRLTSHGGVRDQAQLFTTIKRLYIDQYRRSRVIRFVPLSPTLEPVSDEPFTHGLADNILLEQSLNSLRPQERETLYLSVVEGFTAEEIGKMLDRPRNTVLSQIHRAKAHLAELLADPVSDNDTSCTRKSTS